MKIHKARQKKNVRLIIEKLIRTKEIIKNNYNYDYKNNKTRRNIRYKCNSNS